MIIRLLVVNNDSLAKTITNCFFVAQETYTHRAPHELLIHELEAHLARHQVVLVDEAHAEHAVHEGAILARVEEVDKVHNVHELIEVLGEADELVEAELPRALYHRVNGEFDISFRVKLATLETEQV